ncbi:periplasmic heavy metal sensor [Nguyenibacter vanlangensis]|uniref:Periplasmic heavy metal sensor n=1 Tax=Nguyenibacter vanlangensis TaxID=1216886 RepID=A0ABZ3D306_9PROT
MTNMPHDGRRVRRWVLAGSVLLNLFLAAVVGGQYLRHRTEGAHQATALATFLQNATEHLSPADAAAFRSVLWQDAPRYVQAHENLARARADIDNQLLAPHFDAAATRAAMARWQAAWNGFVGDFSDALVEAISHLSPEGRRTLVNSAPHRKTDFFQLLTRGKSAVGP